MKLPSAALALLALASLASAQARVYVDAGATAGTNDGTSWADAYVDLQLALAAPGVDEVWVAAGTYYPAPAGDQATSFELRSGLALYGGFAGGETDLAQRDPVANPTVLSGDVDQNDTYGTSTNWWQFGWNNNSGNSHHVVTANGADATAVLDGFTIFAGLGDSQSFVGGAGLSNSNASPTIRDCRFEKNAYGRGSAIFNDASSPRIEGCTILDGYTFANRASGMYCQNASFPVVTDTVFDNHYTVATQGQGGGSAVYLGSDCGATFRRCDFTRNQTGNFFAMGDPSGAFGAAIYNLGDDLLVEECTFTENFSHAGSGVFTWGDTTVIDSVFARNRVVGYPITSVATSGDYGAGIATASQGTVLVAGCTIVDNEGHEGVGIWAGNLNPVVLRDSIVWGNVSPPPLPGEDPVWILRQQISGNLDIAHSCVEALLLQEPGEDPPNPADYPGSHDLDPLFVDLAGGDYSLSAGSPCIDAGDNGAVPFGAIGDAAGNLRFHDDPAAADVGLGAAPLVDMGALERAAPPVSLRSDVSQISLLAGGVHELDLDAGTGQALGLYFLLGTTAGTSPGQPLTPTALVLPLNFSAYFLYTALHPNELVAGSLGFLDAAGRGSASLTLPPGLDPGLAGIVFHHAYAVLGLSDFQAQFVSNAMPLGLAP